MKKDLMKFSNTLKIKDLLGMSLLCYKFLHNVEFLCDIEGGGFGMFKKYGIFLLSIFFMVSYVSIYSK